MTIEPRLVWPVGALLGEGPAWIAEREALYFVDIKGGRLHRFTPRTGAKETLELGGMPSFVVPSGDARLVVGSGNRILLVEHDGSIVGVLGEVPMPARNRINDATVDALGRLWFGTMDEAERQATGALYCLDGGAPHRMGGEAIVTNGPAVTADGSALYHVDSVNRTIWRFTISEGPSISQVEQFLKFGEADGYPDGVVLDSEDCLWVALWDGWAVRRYAPDGALLLNITMPCARVTKVAFGGEDLRTVYVTTACVGLTTSERDAQPLAGGLFAFDAPAPGRPLPALAAASYAVTEDRAGQTTRPRWS